jgi:anti-sigma regulatory factor (Ser/Thr protein kinase)
MPALEARRLVLRNELAELDRLALWIESWAQYGVSSDTSLAVQLCVEEVVANVIMYGAPKGSSLEISVELEHVDGTLVARIEDDGREFDPTQAPPPVMASSLQEAKAGNFGIHLVRGFSSGMEYERRDGRNKLRLRFIEPQATSH